MPPPFAQRIHSQLPRVAFFAINFSLGFLVLELILQALVFQFFGIGSPFGLIGLLLFFIPACLFMASEWRALFDRNQSLERILGFVCLAIGGLYVSGPFWELPAIIEAGGIPPDARLPVLLVVLCGLYLVSCGIYRIRSTAGNRGETQ